MKKLRIIVLTTAIVCTMTTMAFAESYPTSTCTPSDTITRQLQSRNFSDYIEYSNCDDFNLDVNRNELLSEIVGIIEDNICDQTITDPNCDSSQTETPDDETSDVDKPVVDKPVVDKPVVDKPVVDKPVVDKPVVDKPVVDKPVVDKPVVDKPVVDKPVVDKPVVDKPVVDKPVIDKPTTDLSDAQLVAEVVRLVNVERTKAGLNPLVADSNIAAAAYVRSTEQPQNFSHTRPNGTSCFTALAEQGVSYRGAGENIAYGQKTPADVMNAWMNSPGHRANILNQNFTKIGVGCYKLNGTIYWTQLFTY